MMTPLTAEVAGQLDTILGDPTDPLPLLAERARKWLPDAVVWEADATNFRFLYISDSAKKVFGHDPKRWTTEPTFWADVILHPEDRDHAIAYCALATGQGRDHDFEYRAVTADGRVRRIYDIVRVVKGPRGVATHLRGIMLDVTSLDVTSLDEASDADVVTLA